VREEERKRQEEDDERRRKEEEEVRKREDEKRRVEEEKRKREEERKRRIEETLRKQREVEEERVRAQQSEIEKKKRLVEEDRLERERKRRLIEEELERTRLEFRKKMDNERTTMMHRMEIETEISQRDDQRRNVPQRPKRGLNNNLNNRVQPQIRNRRLNDFDFDDNDPFFSENDLDMLVIHDYKGRNSLIVGKKLPAVPFKKGKTPGSYLIGQRRFFVEVVNDELKVILGNNRVDFIDFISQQERVQSLKAKALQSAGGLLSLVGQN